MLSNMFIGNPAGNYDRILDFSTAVTGSLFFVPTANFLLTPCCHIRRSSKKVTSRHPRTARSGSAA
jgi:deferrochelatase/peroxidase EfeB